MKQYLTDRTRILAFKTIREQVHPGLPEMDLVKVYPTLTFQPFLGMGAALTEASGWVFAQMDPEQQDEFVDLCFGPQGNRYSMARLSIQSCDFSLAPRAYLDKPRSNLAGFSIDGDRAYVIPLAQRACQANGDLSFLGSPWSPPAWAKTNHSMKRGGRLRAVHYDTWARIIARTVAEYRASGIAIDRLTVQNEPQATQTWESCKFTAAQERTFLHSCLKPALSDAGLADVKTLIWDHNKESVLDRAVGVMGDAAYEQDVDGIAFHWYSGDHFEALKVVRDFIGPDKELVFSEGCDSYSHGDPAKELPHAEHYAHEVIGDLEAGANAILDWNILLDAHGGPNHVGNFCDAPIMYDCDAHTMNVRLPFHYLRHFSAFIQPGAVRVLTSRFTAKLETCCFANPDGTYALIVLNRTDDDVTFRVNWTTPAHASRLARVESPAHSIQTLCFTV